MFLRAKRRFKDGKEHCYWSVVENRRVQGNRVVQRQVLYLGEINGSQQAAWCKTIEVFEEGESTPRQLALFPEDRKVPMLDWARWSGSGSGQVAIAPSPARQGACWLACQLWDQLQWQMISGMTNCRRAEKEHAG